LNIVGIEHLKSMSSNMTLLTCSSARKKSSGGLKGMVINEFLLRSRTDNLRIARTVQLSILKNSSAKKVSFHPHCHQRAEGPSADGLPNGTNATAELLRSCGFHVELMDTGCCGMAGTFGYEAEHYELSMKVGELKVFPKVRELRAANSEAVNRQSSIGNRQSEILSSGAACRLQIRQGTGMLATHPIMLVANFIQGNSR
jgi:Fe-S oxidoreductase